MTARDLHAEMRGLCIHWIRLHLAHRRDMSDRSWRRHVRLSVAVQVEHLRELGAGEVTMPVKADGGTL